MGKRFLISDLHLGHDNIRLYENRPFGSVDEMDKRIIQNINNVVGSHDKLFINGDFSFYNKEKTKELVSKINGYKYLVMGNHDRARSVTWWKDTGFHEVTAYPIVIDKFYIFSHEPMYLNEHMPYVNIHGHIHSELLDSKQHVNVSVEVIDYKPIDFEEIKKKFKEQYNGIRMED